MATTLTDVLTLHWLTGPIFGKELRVSSRRRRNYVLRFVYLLLLLLVVVVTWVNVVDESLGWGSAARRIQMMSEAGKAIIAAIVVFQFYGTQLVAVVLPSTAISDEVYHKTLGVLMTTPVTSLQIVMGKLLSKLWQLLILMAISLPLLAIVRVFGGVPWDYVISSLCINFTAILFTASVSLFYSIGSRRAYAVILRTLLTGLVLFAVLPLVLGLLLFSGRGGGGDGEWFFTFILHANPFAATMYNMEVMARPTRMGGPPFVWWAHCLVMLAASALLLVWVVARVRKVALRQVVGGRNGSNASDGPRFVSPDVADALGIPRQPVPAPGEAGPVAIHPPGTAGPGGGGAVSLPPPLPPAPAGTFADPPVGRIRRVGNAPLLWKELRTPLLGRKKALGIVMLVLTVLALTLLYAALGDHLDDRETHIGLVCLFLVVGMVATAVRSATCITSEKESRSWPILLASPMENRQIALGKVLGTAWNCMLAWAPLVVHVLMFVLCGVMHPVMLLHMTMLVVWVFLFLTGTGMYFSARLRRTTSAVTANLGLALGLWVALPMLLTSLMAGTRSYGGDGLTELCISGNPVVQGVVLTRGSVRSHYFRTFRSYDRKPEYRWPLRSVTSLGGTTGLMIVFTLAGGWVGVIFIFLAMYWFRRRIF